MVNHPFILETGNWIGEGKIRFSMMEGEDLSLTIRWVIPPPDAKGKIAAVQDIHIGGLSENMCNRLIFYDITSDCFNIELQNQSLGTVIGKGIVNKKLIGWEFRLEKFGFEGFEFYETSKQKGIYLFHAEYATSDDFRTVMHGKVWRQEKGQAKKSN